MFKGLHFQICDVKGDRNTEETDETNASAADDAMKDKEDSVEDVYFDSHQDISGWVRTYLQWKTVIYAKSDSN